MVFAIGLAGLLLVGAYFVPWQTKNWGKIEFLPGSTITVTGEAKREEASQIATFTAGVSVTNEDQNKAVNEVNTKAKAIIDAVKNFGIDEADIQTQNISIYQIPEVEIQTFPPQTRESGWRVRNSIVITLRNVDRVSELADLLAGTQATEVSGPNFALDDTSAAQVDLLAQAIEDARTKAQKVAEASGRKLGKIITVTEGASGGPIFRALEVGTADSGVPIEPGTETLSKAVTVVFELK